jgi:hypothetical protein
MKEPSQITIVIIETIASFITYETNCSSAITVKPTVVLVVVKGSLRKLLPRAAILHEIIYRTQRPILCDMEVVD